MYFTISDMKGFLVCSLLLFFCQQSTSKSYLIETKVTYQSNYQKSLKLIYFKNFLKFNFYPRLKHSHLNVTFCGLLGKTD